MCRFTHNLIRRDHTIMSQRLSHHSQRTDRDTRHLAQSCIQHKVTSSTLVRLPGHLMNRDCQYVKNINEDCLQELEMSPHWWFQEHGHLSINKIVKKKLLIRSLTYSLTSSIIHAFIHSLTMLLIFTHINMRRNAHVFHRVAPL